MGIIRGTFRFLAYPLVRTVEQAREETGKVKGDLQKLRELRARRAEKQEQELQEFRERLIDGGARFVPSEDELRNPKLIKNPKVRFEVLCRLNGWDDDGLLQQLTSVRLTKRAAAVLSLVLLTAGLVSLFFAPVWSLLIIVPATGTGAAVTMAQAMRFALFQSQLERRSLHGFGELLGRPDLFRYLFSA